MHQFTVEAARGLPGPRWLIERRTAAAERFAACEPPTTAAEEWRYSAIADFDLGAYRLTNGSHAGSSGSAVASTDHVAAVLGTDHPEVLAVVDVIDGRLAAITGAERVAAAGAFIGPLSDAPGAAAALGSVAQDSGDYFTLLNDAFTPEPVLLDVPAGATLDGMIVVRQTARNATAASFPRLVVRLAEGAHATVVDVQHCDTAALVVPVVELDVAAGARLGYLSVQQHGQRVWHIASQLARVGQEAALVAATVALGGGYARTRTDTRLVGRGASGDLLSAYFGTGEQILDFRTYQDHAAADTTSNLLYLGAVGDRARSVYTGLIRVRPDARGTNAYQTNRNLKLSDDAWAESVPNLEIENNEVRCSHASAVGPVDPEQVFYLESRGVPTAIAERLIVKGFFDEVIDALPARAVAAAIREALTLKLNQMSRVESASAATLSDPDR